MMAASNHFPFQLRNSTEQVSVRLQDISRTIAADLNSTLPGVGTVPSKTNSSSPSPLQRLYQRVHDCVTRLQTQHANDRTVIMIDDVSLLEISAGGRSDEVLAFVQYCRAINSSNNRCSVVLLVHGDTDLTGGAAGLEDGGYVETGEQRVASLAQELDHIADVMIFVDPLTTGLANDVHGQVVVVHWSDVLSSRESRKGVQTLQFKLMENNTLFFHPGGRF